MMYCTAYKNKSPRHSTSGVDWLVSGRTVWPACYLEQTRNDYLANVGVDVLVQVEPLALFDAWLEEESCDRRLRTGPSQHDTCWALISCQRRGGLQFASQQRRIWCRRRKKPSVDQPDIYTLGLENVITVEEIATATYVPPWEYERSRVGADVSYLESVMWCLSHNNLNMNIW